MNMLPLNKYHHGRTVLYTIYTVDIVQTVLHCLNSSMYANIYILLGKVRTLLEWADGLLSQMLGDRVNWCIAVYPKDCVY